MYRSQAGHSISNYSINFFNLVIMIRINMKCNKFSAMVVGLSALVLLGSCKKDEDNDPIPAGSDLPANETWTIYNANADWSRSEERRVGNECVSTCRSRWAPKH